MIFEIFPVFINLRGAFLCALPLFVCIHYMWLPWKHFLKLMIWIHEYTKSTSYFPINLRLHHINKEKNKKNTPKTKKKDIMLKKHENITCVFTIHFLPLPNDV